MSVDNPSMTIQVDLAAVNILIEALSELPAKRSFGLILFLRNEAELALKLANPPPGPAPAEFEVVPDDVASRA